MCLHMKKSMPDSLQKLHSERKERNGKERRVVEEEEEKELKPKQRRRQHLDFPDDEFNDLK